MIEQLIEEEVIEDHHTFGESPEPHERQWLRLTMAAVAKFPELEKKYRVFTAGKYGASVALIGLASIAVYKGLKQGKSPTDILDNITPDDIEHARNEFDPNSIKRTNGRDQH